MNRIINEKPNYIFEGCSIGQFCFFLFIAILSLLKALGFYEGQRIFTAGLVAAFVCLLISLLSVPKTGWEWGMVLVLLLIGTLVYYNTGEKSLLVNFGFLSGMIGLMDTDVGSGTVRKKKMTESGTETDLRSDEGKLQARSEKSKNRTSGESGKYSGEETLKRIVRTGLFCWGIGFVLLTFLALTGVIPEQIYMHRKTGIGFVVCHSLGYAHSNVLHINYLCISAMVLFLVRDHCSRKQKCAITLILFLLDLYVFLYSMSYTGFLASILFYALYLYGIFREKRGGLSTAEAILAQLVLPGCLLFSLVGPLTIRGQLYNRINDLVNTRYDLTKWFLENWPITAFGTRMEVPNYRYTLDCSYAYLLIRLGVVPFAILMVLYLGTIHKLVKENRRTELATMLGLCLAGVTEPFLFNLSFKNMTLVFVGEFLAGELRKSREIARSSSAEYTGSVSGWCLFRSWGAKAVSSKLLIADRAEDGVAFLKKEFQRSGLLYLLIGAVTALAVCILYTSFTKPAQIVFINESVNEEWQSDRDSVIMTDEKVQAFRDAGNIVYGYAGPKEKMYLYTGRTATIEYDRKVVSWGFWTGMAAVFVSAGIGMQRNRCRERRADGREQH